MSDTVSPSTWNLGQEVLRLGGSRPLSVEEQTAALNEALPGFLASHRGTVVGRSERGIEIQARTHMGGIGHGIHAVLTLLTFGLWGIIWAISALSLSKQPRFLVTVDGFGTVVATPK